MKKTILSLFSLLIVLIWVTSAWAQRTINNCPVPDNLRIVKPNSLEVPSKLALLSGIWEGNWGRQSVLFIVEKIEKNEAIVFNSGSGIHFTPWRKKCPIEKGEDGNYTIIMEGETTKVTNRLTQTNDPNSIRVIRSGIGKYTLATDDAKDSIFRRKEMKLSPPTRGIPEQAKKMVEEAVAYIKSNGKEKAFAEINEPKGKFVDGALYVAVFDMNGTCLARGVHQNLIGKNLMAIKDNDGRLYIRELIETAKTQGSGWQDYKYRDGISTVAVYFEKYESLIFLCGAIKPLE